jgi:hypothetical protein
MLAHLTFQRHQSQHIHIWSIYQCPLAATCKSRSVVQASAQKSCYPLTLMSRTCSICVKYENDNRQGPMMKFKRLETFVTSLHKCQILKQKPAINCYASHFTNNQKLCHSNFGSYLRRFPTEITWFKHV